MDRSCPLYEGYYKFVDLSYFGQLLQEISPGFNIEGEPVSINFSASYRSVTQFVVLTFCFDCDSR